jgi:hypothetical protein
MEIPMIDMMNDVTAAGACQQTGEGTAAIQTIRPGNGLAPYDGKLLNFDQYLHVAYSAVCEDIERMDGDDEGIDNLPPSTQLLHKLVKAHGEYPNARSVYEVMGITWWMCGCTNTGLMLAAEDLWDGYAKICDAMSRARGGINSSKAA